MFNKQAIEEIVEIHGEKFGAAENKADTERMLYLYWGKEDDCIEEDSVELITHETMLEIIKHDEKNPDNPDSYESFEYFYVPYIDITSIRILVSP